jgi:cell division protein FtsQ
MWLCIGGGMFTLLLAAISNKKKGQCKDYHIIVKDTRNNFFIDQKDVEQLLIKTLKGDIRGRPVAAFNLHELEQMLERNIWIEEAELYFDNRDELHITVIEKDPVARIFTTEGNSFYIDSLGRKMPLSEKLSARVPVFTGFPDKKNLMRKDSLLLNEVRMTANFIINDPFWMSQVAQIDITPERKFEMVPVIGNHLVKLGNGENIAQKFRRLMVFYKQVLSKTGFDKYKVINVQYAGQVVALRNADNTKVDSAQLRKNVAKLLQQARDAEDDTIIRTIPVTGAYNIDIDSVSNAVTDGAVNNGNNSGKMENPNLAKPALPKPDSKKTDVQKSVKMNKPKPADKKKEPKAVMPKKPAQDTNGGYN